MSWLDALIIAIIEGLTEFLPVSSTGHMIITQKILGTEMTDFYKLFIIVIQFGAILSVVVLYWRKFIQSLNFYYKLLVAFLPAAFFGLLFGDVIDSLLENVLVVAIMLVAGGIILVFVDSWFKNTEKADQTVTYKKSLIIGLFQVIAMIPGVSRSAATIIGGMTQKLTRKNAAEFSFFLAVPTMFAASAYKLLEFYLDNGLSTLTDNIGILIFGNVIAFIVALIAIKTFIAFLTKYGFKIFGYYRIIVGAIIIILLASGVNLSIV
jgi:undecaprenyl-diphosphatase